MIKQYNKSGIKEKNQLIQQIKEKKKQSKKPKKKERAYEQGYDQSFYTDTSTGPLNQTRGRRNGQ